MDVNCQFLYVVGNHFIAFSYQSYSVCAVIAQRTPADDEANRARSSSFSLLNSLSALRMASTSSPRIAASTSTPPTESLGDPNFNCIPAMGGDDESVDVSCVAINRPGAGDMESRLSAFWIVFVTLSIVTSLFEASGDNASVSVSIDRFTPGGGIISPLFRFDAAAVFDFAGAGFTTAGAADIPGRLANKYPPPFAPASRAPDILANDSCCFAASVARASLAAFTAAAFAAAAAPDAPAPPPNRCMCGGRPGLAGEGDAMVAIKRA